MILNLPESAVAGIVLGGLNFWFLFKMISSLINSEKVSKAKTGVYFFGKMGIVFPIIGLILWKGYVTPLGFLVGFTLTLVTGIFITLYKGRKKTYA